MPIPIDGHGDLDLEALAKLFSKRTKLLAVSQISNSLGTVVPVAEICALAREHGVPVAVDGAQAVPHERVDVQALGCDFYAFSGHKVFAPNGIGVLWGKAEHLKAMPPREGGGGMIRTVTFEKTTFAEPPERFEAGTPNVEGVIGLGAALGWLESARTAGDESAAGAPPARTEAEAALSPSALERSAAAHERRLLDDAVRKLADVPGLRIIGSPKHRASLVSFVLDGIHPHDAGTVLDAEGVAVRAGHHCAQPVMERFGVPATIRASFGIYSQPSDVDALVSALYKTREIFGAGS
jgi:cysteine desulfurase / selenocysteine lyase